MTKELKFQDSLLEIKGVDKKDRTAEFYVTTYGNVDLGDDVMVKGAVTKSVKERGPQGTDKIRHLWNHDSALPIGKPIEMYEDAKGLVVVSKFGSDTFSNDKFIQYSEGIVKFQSVGYSTVKAETEDGQEWKADQHYDKTRYLKEIKLYEYSGVVFPMNEEAGMKSFKSLVDKAGGLSEYIENLSGLVHKSNASDDFLETLEFELKKLSLLAKSEPVKPLEKPNEPIDLIKIYNQIKSNS